MKICVSEGLCLDPCSIFEFLGCPGDCSCVWGSAFPSLDTLSGFRFMLDEFLQIGFLPLDCQFSIFSRDRICLKNDSPIEISKNMCGMGCISCNRAQAALSIFHVFCHRARTFLGSSRQKTHKII